MTGSVDAAISRRAPIFIIGAGRLGIHLAAQLGFAGARDITLWNRSRLPAVRASIFEEIVRSSNSCRLAPGIPLRNAGLEKARLVLLTVSDDAIEDIAEALACEVSLPPTCPVLHTAGALSSEILGTIRARGNPVGSLHPLRSFSGPPKPGDLKGTVFALEGTPKAVEAGLQLVRWFSGRPVEVELRGKILYHAAAVMASNLLVGLVACAVDILDQSMATDDHGADDSAQRNAPRDSGMDSLEILLPLIKATVANLETQRLPHALTGPVSRGDVDVVRRHVDALQQLASEPGSSLESSLPVLYRLLSCRTIELARQQGLAAPRRRALLKLLE